MERVEIRPEDIPESVITTGMRTLDAALAACMADESNRRAFDVWRKERAAKAAQKEAAEERQEENA